ncbi:MAG TPA: hypothetical protein VG267_21380 [Terracidiphilus sp.]|jgi:hypothetical protein|nr:hypothetical protein [Terracidiphilus sp.]
MRFPTWRAGLAAALLLTAAPLFAQSSENQGQGQAVITVVPKGKDASAPVLSQQNLALTVDGKSANITRLTPANGRNGALELVVMLDSGARTSLSTQIPEIASFIKGLPPDAHVAIGWMENGVTHLTGPLTTDHQAALKGLHIPGGFPGEDASPYFCLSDLAKHWPSSDPNARREVVMIGDGVDYYYRRYDPDDPYVQATITDSVRAGLVVYSIYWKNKGRFDETMYANDAGQNLLLEVTAATGGYSYWEGMGDPVSFQPYFEDLNKRLGNQYEVGFVAPLKNKPEVLNMKVKVNGVPAKVDSPQRVYVGRATGTASSMQ